MGHENIRGAVQSLKQRFLDHPEKAIGTDPFARARELSIPLRHLEVQVESRSNDCGMIGIDDAVPAGPLEATMQVAIGAEGASRETLMEIVNWGIAHSPMADGLTRAVPMRTAIDIV